MAKELFSNKIERAMLGLLVRKPNLMTQVSGAIDPVDFYYAENSSLFSAILETFKKHGTADEILIVEEYAHASNVSKDEATKFIADISVDAGVESNIPTYMEQLREYKKSRDLELTFKESADLVSKSPSSTIELIGEVERKLYNLTKDVELKNLDEIEKLTNEFEIKIKQQQESGVKLGIRTGFDKFDEKIGGFRGGQFVIIAARPSVGKTAFSLSLTQAVAKNYKVGFFSLEMPSEQIIMRMLTNQSRLNSHKIENGRFINQAEQLTYRTALDKIKQMKLWVDDSASLKVTELAWKARKLKEQNGLDIIFIDYLQLISADERLIDNRQQAVAEISKQLKELARELDIPVIALSQLSRKIEQGTSRKPLLSDIRDSGSIEQDADIVMFLHREDYQKGDDEPKEESSISEIEVIIAKHRNGSIGTVYMQLDKAHGSIREVIAKEPTMN